MRIFFSLRHPGTLRNFASTIGRLEQRGHHVHLSFTMQDRLGDGRLLWEVTHDRPGITVGDVREKAPWRLWIRLARGVRAGTDYLRYLTPAYRHTPALKARAEEKTPKGFQLFCRLPLVSSGAGLRLVARMLALVERALPSDRLIEQEIAAARPDLVLVSPLVDFASDQVDVVKSAKALGVRTALCVHSWDNLTNKGLIRIPPDRVFVWNEMQKREAITMHGADPSSVVVTGAPTYDQWFDWKPSRTRAEFCEQVDLAPDRPFFVYLCSSPFIAPNEAEFIERWIREVRATSDPDLAQAGLLIRPHPENRQPWHRVGVSTYDNVAIWPKGGSNPVDTNSKNGYYDSLFHSVAAVGVNTSALIEAGIVGRAVFTVRLPEHAATQDGTLHFHHLLNVSGGLLRVADGFDEHRHQLADALRQVDANALSARAFVEDFVRPRGLETEATAQLVDGIETLGQLPRPSPERTPWWLLPLRGVLYPVAWAMKLRRQLERTSRKRERRLRPVSAGSLAASVLLAPAELLLKWRPVREFARTYVVPRIAPRGVDADRPTEEMVAVRRLALKLSRNDQPLLLGPWHGSVTTELLYWIPFLRWVRAQHRFAADPVVVISRGGAASWYQGLGTQYVDLFDFFTPEQLRARLDEHEGRTASDFDREVLKLVQVSIGTRRASHLQPLQMLRLFGPFWQHQAPIDLVAGFTAYQALGALEPAPPDWHLPERYVAVKFTFNEAFPDTDGNREFVRQVVGELSQHSPVVLLNTGQPFERGPELPPAADQIRRVDQLLSPRNNLDIQTRIIGQSRLFVGNYDGIAHVAPYCGVRSLAFFSNPAALSGRHLEAARHGFAALGPGSLLALDARDWLSVHEALGVERRRESSTV